LKQKVENLFRSQKPADLSVKSIHVAGAFCGHTEAMVFALQQEHVMIAPMHRNGFKLANT
jgi:hypothetical protein